MALNIVIRARATGPRHGPGVATGQASPRARRRHGLKPEATHASPLTGQPGFQDAGLPQDAGSSVRRKNASELFSRR